MSGYTAPVRDMLFTLREVAGLDRLAALDGGDMAAADMVAQVLDEAGKLASEVLAPINASGDREGCRLDNGVVRTPAGFKEAYRRYFEGGWNGMPFETAHGGQNAPWVVATAVAEMFQSANMAWTLCPLLTSGAIELLQAHASAEQKRRYLPRLVSGEWTCTMNLTEPQAGSDVGAIRTKAARAGEHYKITGQKIFITFGDHDFTDNIIHMVLARTPDAPPGSRGISLFIVPKIMVAEDGTLQGRNDLRCVSLEHKLGIAGAPTAVMAFGDNGGATGFLVGEENRGLEYMFTMMNNARLSVGLQGVAIAERAYQQARAYARARVQSRELGASTAEPVAIIRHPDVRRMLMTMKAGSEAARALTYTTMCALDLSRRHPDKAERERQLAQVDLLTPVVKAWCTDLGVEIASIGIQVHGGMGFIEETGAAQHLRDARIAPIYEGTNGIQANDLVFRKLGRDGGAAARIFLESVAAEETALAAEDGANFAAMADQLGKGRAALAQATDFLVATLKSEPRQAAAAAVPYLKMFGNVAAGQLMARGARAAARALADGDGDSGFLAAKIATARFFADHFVSQAPALLHPVIAGAAGVLDIAEDQI